MKTTIFILLLLVVPIMALAQVDHVTNDGNDNQSTDVLTDSTDIFYQHLLLNEIIITGLTGDTRITEATAPVDVISLKKLRQTASSNIIDAVSHQAGMSQLTTGGGISKPVIRGLGYNRIVVMNEGIRQEGQQWGDEHGIEIDPQNIGKVEILKGPASLMYGSDAMAGVLILKENPVVDEGSMKADLSSEYQSNNGLFDYSVNFAGNKKGFVWDARFSDKYAHAYKNKYDGYVPGSQFSERAGRLMLGVNRKWGHSYLTWSAFHLTPSIVEGERNEETGRLEYDYDNVKTYSKTLPFQQVKHYKAVSDNSFYLPKGWIKAIVGYQQNRRQEFEESDNDYELFFKLHTLTYDFRYLSEEFDGWKVNAGMNGMWQKSLNLGEESLIPEYRLFDFGTYVTASKSIEHLTMSGGLRYDTRHLDFHSRHFSAMTGSIGAVWHVNSLTNLRFNMARGYRAPNMSELGSDGVHEGTVRYEIGNPKLKPEYSWQADFGADWSGKLFSLQMALFANRIQNYIFAKRISQIVEEGYLTYQYTQSNAWITGFEAVLDFHPIHSVHFENSFSYVRGRLSNSTPDAKCLPLMPAPRWNSEIKYELTHSRHIRPFNNAYIALGMECNFAQNRFYKVDQTETRTPSYALFNISAGTDVMIKNRKIAEVYVIADNIFNKAYQNHLSRLKYCEINTITGRQGIFNMGRNITFKVIVPISVL